MEDNELLTGPTAAREKGVHVKSLYRAIREGRLKAERQGPTILIRRRDLKAWQPSRRIQQARERAAREGGTR
jgi:excisionase family DNA binding protein